MPNEAITVKTARRDRALAIRRDTLNEEARTVEAVFATETPVDSWSWDIGEFTEILDCTPESFDGARFESGGQFLKEHDRKLVVGSIVSFRFENGEGIAVLRYANTPLGDEELQLMRDGDRKNFSVSYIVRMLRPEQLSPEQGNVFRAVDWEGMEISVVSVPADPKCTAIRSRGQQDAVVNTTISHMNIAQMARGFRDKENGGATGSDNFDAVAERTKIREEVLRSQKEITESAAQFRKDGREVGDLAARALAEGWTADKFRAEAQATPVVTAEQRAKLSAEIRAEIVKTTSEIDASAECFRSLGLDFSALATQAKAEGWTVERFRADAETAIKAKTAKSSPVGASTSDEEAKRAGLTGIDRVAASIKLK